MAEAVAVVVVAMLGKMAPRSVTRVTSNASSATEISVCARLRGEHVGVTLPTLILKTFREDGISEQSGKALEAAALAARVAAVDLSELLTAYANSVVSCAAFGDDSAWGLFDDGDSGRRQSKVFTDFQKLIGTVPVGELLPWLGWVDAITGLEGKIRQTFEALDRAGGEGGGDGRDFVDVLLDFHKNDKEHGIQLETNEIKDIIFVVDRSLSCIMGGGGVTTHSAGHVRGRHGYDTTTMEWAMAELVTHPRAMRRAQDEVRTATAGSTGVNEDHVAQLDYLKAMLLPFGAGRRVCLGMGFAEASAEMALASLLYHFDWEVDGGGVLGSQNREGTPTPSLDMTEMNGIAVHIKSGLPLLAKPWVP
ncbi:unnamed protein product [Miscanthus lutarioriparius]|uniref:Cytochrome P450 n=1 Tax=Miscanthus lutarioriparius TaxID=422564 RepID=A0A811NYT2_9POAL|nr:unnamed protein product [Miscanthus lutarioriparius]